MLQRELALFVCGAVELGFEKLLAQTGASPRHYGLHGKRLAIELTELPFPLFLIFDDSVTVLSRYEAETDVRVKASVSALYALSQGESLSMLIKADRLDIDGDLNVLQGFSRLIKEQQFDIGEPLSRYIGDGPAHKLQSGGRWLGSELKRIGDKTLSHLAQLSTEEYRLAPHRIEFIHLKDNIDSLVQDTDTIEKRINQLRDRLTP